jgi:hypothetical protein
MYSKQEHGRRRGGYTSSALSAVPTKRGQRRFHGSHQRIDLVTVYLRAAGALVMSAGGVRVT